MQNINRIYTVLRDRIITGELAENDKVVDTDLAVEFQVSRTPIREVLKKLEMQGLVKSYPGNATLVTAIDWSSMEKPYILMTALQQIAAAEAAQFANKNNIAELTELSRNFKFLCESGADTLDILKSDMDFHAKVLEMSQNRYNADFCDTLYAHIGRMEYGFFRHSPSLKVSASEHEKIIATISLGDSYTASLHMRDHWTRTVMELHSKWVISPDKGHPTV